MSDNYIKVTVTGNKSKSVSVKSTELKNQITAGADMSIYYSNKAKEWAISDKLVDNEDYSSKYHANLAKSYTEEGSLQIAEITTLRELTLADIETEKQNVIDMGTEQINQVSTISNTAISDIETSKTNALSDIEFVADGEKKEIEDLIDNGKDEIQEGLNRLNTTTNNSIADINTTAKSYDNLTKRQITNCLLEVPQRIKYTLENGTLTIKAGSVVIVPYGTTDRTSEFPVGATFIHDNFKVYDTQFADGKFFVLAELVNDIASGGETTDARQRSVFVNLTLKNVSTYVYSGSGTADYTGTSNYALYRTDENVMKLFTTTSGLRADILSLPIGRCTADGVHFVGTIDQIFNGMGYIGSTVWVDKGVKGLSPNGRNEDGSLKNTELTVDKLITRTFNTTENVVLALYVNSISKTSFETYTYKENENINYSGSNVWDTCVIGSSTLTNGVISNFQPKQPFRAVDHSELEEVHCVVETYKNGASWYRIWSDGWCEQGGANLTSNTTVTLMKPYTNTNYTLTITYTSLSASSDGNNAYVQGGVKTTKSFYVRTRYNTTTSGDRIDWKACGYIA